jgi:hypothetical protein
MRKKASWKWLTSPNTNEYYPNIQSAYPLLILFVIVYFPIIIYHHYHSSIILCSRRSTSTTVFAADFFFKQTWRLSSRSIVVYSYRVILIVSRAFCFCQIKRCHKFARLLRLFRLDQAVCPRKLALTGDVQNIWRGSVFSLKSTLTTSCLEVKGKKEPILKGSRWFSLDNFSTLQYISGEQVFGVKF